jgi:hypothetical protein
MNARWARFERGLSRLEQRPVRLVWLVCAVIAAPAAFIQPAIMLWIGSFAMTTTLVLRIRALRQRPGAAMLLAPVVWLITGCPRVAAAAK